VVGDRRPVVARSARPARPGARGFTVLETVVGLAVTTIVMTAALDGGRIPAIAATKSLERLQATRAAQSALERLDRTTLVEGSSTFDPKIAGATGHLVLRRSCTLLFDATATVRTKEGVAVSLTTRLLKETPR
jgi:hypothetical protein